MHRVAALGSTAAWSGMGRTKGSSLSCKLQKDLGEVFLAALADPETVEILLNADGTLRQERLGQPLRTNRDHERQ